MVLTELFLRSLVSDLRLLNSRSVTDTYDLKNYKIRETNNTCYVSTLLLFLMFQSLIQFAISFDRECCGI